MPLIPLLPIFHKFNGMFFDETLTDNQQPLIKIKWSDNRLKTTAGFYKRKKLDGVIFSEIILSKPILENLSIKYIQSTLCHEMIHAWVDRILKINEIHGPNFIKKMDEINSKQNFFEITIRHDFPVFRKALKYKGTCNHCGEKYLYRRRIRNIACKKCCNLFFNGKWNKKCLITFDEF